jgi:hypothetical protein
MQGEKRSRERPQMLTIPTLYSQLPGIRGRLGFIVLEAIVVILQIDLILLVLGGLESTCVSSYEIIS